MENSSGSLLRVLEKLGAHHIQLHAISVADTADYGIFRIICNNPKEAFKVLEQEGFAASLTEVIVLEVEDVPGAASRLLSVFAQEGLSIAYLYSFHYEGRQALAFRTDDRDRARKIITAHSLTEII
ncbi:MAG: amino acid-binding protein [Bacteroidales bacterium]|nr:amino acid-binding protein [Bacteroidales bacterium]